MLIIPAIDIMNNNVVRLEKGDYNKSTLYDKNPLQQAIIYADNGFELIHIVDLLGSKTGSLNIMDIIKETKQKTNLKIEFGGGIRTLQNISDLIDAGVDYLIVGSMTINNKPEFEAAINKFGPDKFVSASDVLNEKVMVKGWTEDSGLTLNDHIDYCCSLNIERYLCTDISKDGLLAGPNFDLYKRVAQNFPDIKLYASGGISCLDDVVKLNGMNLHAAIVGKAIYENKISLEELIKIGK